ncbi:uncharacterized protein HMPREF1541_08844 [Cyphellophora europaea CBS 101466]|uniref:UBC core domain-containing protein n=1 Tax=Cyphellophora europaea (strain CBS 101466) TaxID=1220924 RepID=W2RJB7_CYPE1|nr:uncharacterized protein HMPREF1541_08844 [Cyphellophora europaea CBS 101466]ETN36566.1 hypothetical protein HMPREF1541_08844 [Cyphellophora europaea CBS 101466]
MPTFEVNDTVVLKNDCSLVGTIERTAGLSDGFESTSLEDLLIVNYTDVPERVLIDFVNSAIPPREYVFIICVDEERGAFLTHENDLELLSRSFDLGDVVKKNGQSSSMIGTVINYTDTYALDHVFHETRDGRLISSLAPDAKQQIPSCGDNCVANLSPHNYIFNVSAQDITHAQDVFEGDLALYDDWLGAIEEAEFDIVLRLTNDSIVILKSPQDLHLPIKDPEKPLVSLPEFDNLRRPNVIDAFQGWSTIPALKTPGLGSFVATSRATLKAGRWIRGEYIGATPPEGIVIGVIPRTVDARWITPSPFTRKPIRDLQHPSHRHTVYKNINAYRNPTELKPREGLKICDGTSYPSARSQTDSSVALLNNGSQARSTGAYQDLRPGDQVRFRDPTAASVKYAGVHGTRHGAFRRISSSQHCPGWDLNILKIVSKTQMVVVQWQDGSETTITANELHRFAAFESALTPGQAVLNRAGLQQSLVGHDGVGASAPQFIPFNEMAFFERPHNLHPSKVGIVQAVDHQERVAKVRWFEKPKVVLIEAGELLSPESWFGPISSSIEEVSLYEIMTFPAFDKRLRDFVVLPPNTTLEELRKNIKNKKLDEAYDLPMATNPALDFDRLITRAKTCMHAKHIEETQRAISSEGDNGDGTWIGEIVGIGLDGTLTVRMRGGKICRDTQLPLDVVLACINVDELGVQDYDAEEDLEEWWEDYVEGRDDSRSPSPISQSFEYEGGARLDTDEDDDAWTSAEEDMSGSQLSDGTTAGAQHLEADEDGYIDEDVEMADASTQTAVSLPSAPTAPPRSGSFATLRQHLPSEPPLPFEVLDILPPADQYSADLHPSTSSTFLKRIRKEHKTLASSLPPGQIYVRTYDSRLDLLRCLIIGPPDTPYEDAPFLVDLYLGPKFPDEPPIAHFHSWTSGLGRINPNLYEEGKICLSLLGTWPGKESGEGWSKDATILQLLVSLQGLVMVRNPFFNEAGFEGYEQEGGYRLEAAQYAEKAFVMARGFVRHALERPPRGVEDVLAWLFLPDEAKQEQMGAIDQAEESQEEQRRGLLLKILQRGRRLIESSEAVRTSAMQVDNDGQSDQQQSQEVQLMDAAGSTGDATKAFLRPLSKGAVVMLRRMLAELDAAGSVAEGGA